MNDTTPPAGATGPTSGPNPGPHPGRGSDRFFDWLRGLGIVRGRERWFAGVAGGIAAKAGIDPLIVRGVFVVLAILGGPGLLLYLAGWLLLPDDTGRIHLEELFRGRASAGVITAAVILGVIFVVPLLLLILSIVVPTANAWGWNSWPVFGYPAWLGTVFSVIWWAVLLPAAIVWLVVWLVRRDSGGAGAGAARPGPESHAAGDAAAQGFAGGSAQASATFVSGADGTTAAQPFAAATGDGAFASGAAQQPDPQARAFAEQPESFGERVNRKADEWGRVASEKANEWGEQANEWGRKVGDETAAWGRQYEATRLGAAQTVLTLAIALLAAGGAASWALTSDALQGSPLPGDGSGAFFAALIAALAVCALSLIVAGARGRRTGWIGFLSFCGVVVLIFTAVVPWGSRVHLFGAAEVTVTESSPPGLVMIAGSARIDLSEIDDAQSFSLWMVGGNATIELPESRPVVVHVGLVGGNITEIDESGERQHQAGPFPNRVMGANLRGADPDEVSRVSVYIVGGNVTVDGTNASTALVDRHASAAGRLDAPPRADLFEARSAALDSPLPHARQTPEYAS